MFKQIERNDSIFQSDLFKRDSLSFCVIKSILNDKVKYPTPKIFSDGKGCAIVNSDSKDAVIVWTTDDFKEKTELYNFIKEEFQTNTPFTIMSKNSFYDYLVECNKISESSTQPVGVYTCSKLKDILYVGYPDQARPEEVKQVAQMLVNFDKETGENPQSKIEDYLDLAQKFVSNPTFQVWRNTEEKIVAIALIRFDEDYLRISRVYTNVDERGKSYAKMLVHYLTTIALNEGKEPMLFTDYDYMPSNRCYQAIGYEFNYTIVNFTL